MSRLIVHSFTISLDSYGAGPDQSLERPLGRGGENLHGSLAGTGFLMRWRRMHRVVMVSIACLTVLGCGKDDFADDPMIRQGQEWSGSAQLPVCRRTGPDGEDLGSPDARYCEWSSPTESTRGNLTAIVRGGSTLLTWRRDMVDPSDADRLTDSIRTALLARGLRERDCGTRTNLSGESRGLRWEGADAVFDVTRVTPRRGAPRIQIVATDVPAEMPPILCGSGANGP